MSLALRALLFRRTGEPQTLTIEFDGAVYAVRLRRHALARRYTLRIHAASRDVVLTMPPRGSVKAARAFAQKHGGWIAARLGRLPRPAPFTDGTRLPLRGLEHRIVHRPGARGTVWPETAADGERLLCVAGAAAHLPRRDRRFPQARGQARSRNGEPPRRRRACGQHQARVGARPGEPLGLLLDHRRVVLFLASHSGAAFRARLSRRARGRAFDRDEPLAQVLAAGRGHLPAHGRSQSLARRPWRRSAPLRRRPSYSRCITAQAWDPGQTRAFVAVLILA